MKKDSSNKPLAFIGEALRFPPVEEANSEGLLAFGGDLSVERLVLAYQQGIFPWFNEGSMILWWSPDPRMVLHPAEVKISKSMAKVIKSNQFTLTKDKCFDEVIDRCSKIARKGQDGTWITQDMKKAYLKLHELGYAHSYEVWENGILVGGLYGIDLGHVFCGESMFSAVSNASKFAFIKLAKELEKKKYKLIDCQVYTEHLASLGAKEMPRKEFIGILKDK
ncbi:leucyl/phenylalanyl-tRNA--protein transferase [Maribacter polysaccharolyticus]|uniref:leucyl/phenylalanyl-tRNA--protein transferase n=1 Tax=Maribacter polysaccharolyticus TaxID=3020831 RepID=UPI00237F38C5|nr:leucyl/phenylalanyl-tRNA--protein transferase [Maribacter polysaccharolyticus]MDE3743016.1 leucyl/phenylalanyl-tRNA--protein transferase [Maribacter polysaccharolyticus]